LRGYNFNIQKQAATVNLNILEKNFKAGDVVSPAVLTREKINQKYWQGSFG